MNKRSMVILTILMLELLITGCAQNAVNTSRNNETYSTSMRLILQPDFADRSFSSSEDFSLSTEFDDVTYIWPEGKGYFSKKFNEISFKGKSISCGVVKRVLTVNGRRFGKFEEGDSVRITGDGKVFVNDVEQGLPDDS